MRILIVGGSGFVGKRLVQLAAEAGHHVIVTSRREREGAPATREGEPAGEYLQWDTVSPLSLPAVDAVCNLAGEDIFARRWSDSARAEIRRSRIESTRLLVESMAAAEQRPSAFVCASAIGFYGFTGDEKLEESASPGEGFLPEVSRDWEEAAKGAEPLGIRTVRVRIGVVLGQGAGAIDKMLLPFKLGLGGKVASGQQWMSWIHLDDMARLLLFALENERVAGALNGTAPNPVTNLEFTKALGRVLGRPTFLPVPAFGLRLLYGDVAEVIVRGQRVVPARALESGFEFRFPELPAALADILT